MKEVIVTPVLLGGFGSIIPYSLVVTSYSFSLSQFSRLVGASMDEDAHSVVSVTVVLLTVLVTVTASWCL